MQGGVAVIDDHPSTSCSAETPPILSVVIPCRNAAETLATQLEALAGQRSPVPWEVVLCDNGSTDCSRSIAESYRTRLPRLTIVDAPGCRGAGAVRNVGADWARGRWLAFCDADDEVASGWLPAMARALSENRFVAGRFESQRLNDPRARRSRELPQESRLMSGSYGARLPHAGAGNMGIHRDLFLDLGGFDPNLRWLEDTDLCWRAQLSGEGLTFVPDAVVHVRLRASLSSTARQAWEYGRAHVTLQQRYERPGKQAPGAATTMTPRSVVPFGRRMAVAMRNPRHLAWKTGHWLGRRAQRWDKTSPVNLGPPRLADEAAHAGRTAGG